MKNLLLLFVVIFALASCSKKVSELPGPSENGANTFGAKVDGKLWAPQGFGIMPTASTLEANFAGGDNYKINARNFGSSPTETEFEFLLTNITGPGTYTLNETNKATYTLRKFQPISIWTRAWRLSLNTHRRSGTTD